MAIDLLNQHLGLDRWIYELHSWNSVGGFPLSSGWWSHSSGSLDDFIAQQWERCLPWGRDAFLILDWR